MWIYANRPLDNDANLDDSAQIHLNKYMDEKVCIRLLLYIEDIATGFRERSNVW